MANSILIIVVLYNQDLFQCITYKTLLRNCNNLVFVYDNSPISLTDENLIPSNWKYIHNPENPGLSYAYNRGAEYAKKNHCDWLLIADQDTEFSNNLINSYEQIINQNRNIGIVAPIVKTHKGEVISPVRLTIFKRKKFMVDAQKEYCLKKYFPINSGLFINLRIFSDAGGYNENVFLDYSDFEFCERASKICENFHLSSEICYQTFSNDEEDEGKVLSRFSLFCKSIMNCSAITFWKKTHIALIIMKRTLSLCIRFKTLRPLNILLMQLF